MKRKLLSLLMLLMTAVTGAWAETVTWNSTNVFKGSHEMDRLSKWNLDPLTYEGITISFSGTGVSDFKPYEPFEGKARLTCYGGDGDSFTFTAPSGKVFTKIEIIDNSYINFTSYGDWTQPEYTKIVWSGTPASTVTLGGSNSTFATDLNSIVFTLATVVASGTSGDVSWTLTDDGVLIISGTGAMADYADGNSVPWASNQADITSVVIENGVTTIGNYAFYYCRNLTSVSIPAGVTSIGDYAFIYCGLNAATNLTVTISGSSLTTIGREAFSLANLKSITIPASVTSIGFAAFNNCGNLETMTLNSNPTLGAGALDGFKAGAVVTMNLTGHEGDTGEYWMTFYNRNYSFTADGNTTIYKAAVNSGNTAVVLTEVDDIPFANAAVLKSSNATITMTLAASASADYSDNELEGSDSPIVANAGDDIYCLSKETSGSSPRGVGFYTFTGTIPANRAYLEVPGGPTTARGFLGFSDDDNTTDIEAIDHSPLTIDHSVYDLSGRLVTGQPQKGIYVKNGKKVVIK